jgi:hypothetical protein
LLSAGKQLALAEFQRHVEIAPDNPEPYTGRGHVRALLGDYRGAIEDADRATQLGSDNAGLYFNAAGIYAECIGPAEGDRSVADGPAIAEQCRRRAIECLSECLEKSTGPGPDYRREAQRDPAFDAIRDSEEFRQLLGTPPT